MDETAGVVAMLEQAVRLTAPSPMCLTPSHCHTLQVRLAIPHCMLSLLLATAGSRWIITFSKWKLYKGN